MRLHPLHLQLLLYWLYSIFRLLLHEYVLQFMFTKCNDTNKATTLAQNISIHNIMSFPILGPRRLPVVVDHPNKIIQTEEHTVWGWKGRHRVGFILPDEQRKTSYVYFFRILILFQQNF